MPKNSYFLFVTTLFLVVTILIGIFLDAKAFHVLIWPMAVYFLGISLLRYSFFFFGVFYELIDRRDLNNETLTDFPSVSIIVPAYNEEKVIVNALRSLLEINYENLEIIVIDDGSTDGTYALAQMVAMESTKVPVRVFKKANGGKASALNYGILNANGVLFMCVDADSRIHPDSITYGVRHFDNPLIGAVAGYVEIANQNNYLLNCQQLEYMVGLNFTRRTYSFFGIVPIVPGPVGLFRRTAILDLGGYIIEKSMFAEDAELSLRLLSKGWLSKSEEKMVAYTEGPANMKQLLKQRYRWNRGTFQALRANFSGLVTSAHLRHKFLAIHLLLESWIFLVINLALLYWFVVYGIFSHASSLYSKWMFALIIIEMLVVFIAIIPRKNALKWLGIALVSKFVYEPILVFWKVFSLYDEWSSTEMSWGKLVRSGDLGKGDN